MIITADDILNIFIQGFGYQKKIITDQFTKEYMEIKDHIRMGLTIVKQPGKEGRYIAHVKIPSRSTQLDSIFYYDVVFELVPINRDMASSPVLDKYKLAVYCNSPSFLYTHTYVYNKNGLMIDWLKDRCSKIALTKPPLKANPQSIVGVDKVIWYAMFHMKRLGLLNKTSFSRLVNTDVKTIAKLVIPQETLIANQNRQKELAKITRKNLKDYEKDDPNKEYRLRKNIEHAIVQNNANSKNKQIPIGFAKKVVKEARKARDARRSRAPKRPR